MGPPRRQTSSATGQHGRGHDIHGRFQNGPWLAGHAGAERARGQDRRRLAQAGLEGAHSPHVTSENGWATTTALLQLTATVDNVLNPSREGQAWIVLWYMASIHATEASLAAMRATFPHVVLCFIPPHSTSYLQPCDVAVFRSFKSCIPDVGERHSCPLRWRRLRAHTDDEFRETEEANELHTTGALFAREIEPEPAPEDPVERAMAEASDDEDVAPMTEPPGPELIDLPPAPASAPPMSTLERSIALRLVYGAGQRQRLHRMATCISTQCLSAVSRVVVSCVLAHTRVLKKW